MLRVQRRDHDDLQDLRVARLRSDPDALADFHRCAALDDGKIQTPADSLASGLGGSSTREQLAHGGTTVGHVLDASEVPHRRSPGVEGGVDVGLELAAGFGHMYLLGLYTSHGWWWVKQISMVGMLLASDGFLYSKNEAKEEVERFARQSIRIVREIMADESNDNNR